MQVFSPEKLLVIGMLALLVLGPQRLPLAARRVGRVVAQLRRMSGSLQTEMRDALAEPRQALQHAVEEFGIEDMRTSLRESFVPAAPGVPLEPAPGAAAEAAATAAHDAGTVAPPAPDDPSLN